MERKKSQDPQHETKLAQLIDTLVGKAKKEMDDEIRSGICGKVLEEDELQGTPNKQKPRVQSPRRDHPHKGKRATPPNSPDEFPRGGTLRRKAWLLVSGEVDWFPF